MKVAVSDTNTFGDDVESRKHRRLGLPSATALVVANMIGAGVFTTSGFALKDLGSPIWVMLAWLVAGFVAMTGALSYGALARRMPQSGGEYYFLSRTLHPLAGFLAGWISLLAGFTAPIALAALGLQAYLAPIVGADLRPEWIGSAAIAFSAFLHGLRLGPGVFVQNLAVGLKLALIVGFIAVGAASLPTQEAITDVPVVDFAIGPFAVSLVWISYSYLGWNAAVYVAGEVKDPHRNLNRSLWAATALVMVVYLGLNAVFVFSAPVEVLAGRADIGAAAAEALGGTWLRNGVSLLVALALFTSISSMMMAGPRVYATMAADGLFPRGFSFRGTVPGLAVALQAGLAVVVVWISDLAELLGYVGLTLGVCAAATVIGLLRLRRKEGPEKVPIPLYPWLPLVFIVTTLTTTVYMATIQQKEATFGFLTVATGVPVYWVLRRLDRSPVSDSR